MGGEKRGKEPGNYCQETSWVWQWWSVAFAALVGSPQPPAAAAALSPPSTDFQASGGPEPQAIAQLSIPGLLRQGVNAFRVTVQDAVTRMHLDKGVHRIQRSVGTTKQMKRHDLGLRELPFLIRFFNWGEIYKGIWPEWSLVLFWVICAIHSLKSLGNQEFSIF